jgi:hypothetical protein
MKIITYSRIGYNHPSQANWNYDIWKVDTIDTDKAYNMSYTVKETFGGDSRFASRWSNSGVPVIETKGVYPQQKITGIRSMLDMEGEEFNSEIVAFINNK